jgi:MFS family permease
MQAASTSPSTGFSRGYANYVLGICFALTALNVMDRQVLSILVEPVKGEFDLSDSQMGLLTGSAFALSHALAMIPVARLADLGSRRNVIAAGLFAWSALTALTGAARAYWHLFMTRVGVGACETVGSGPAQSLLSDYFPPERRGAALSIHASGGTFGAMAGFAIGGWLADAVGWRWTFVCFGAPGLLLALVLWRTVREPARGGADGVRVEGPAPTTLETLRYLGALPSFRHVVLAASLNSFVNWAMLSWAAAAMMRAHGFSMGEVGIRLATSMTLTSALGLVAAGFITDRLGRRDARWYLWWPAAASLGAIPFTLAFLLVSDPTVAFLVIVPGAFLNTMWVGAYNAVVQGLAKPRMRAMASAVHVLVSSALIGQGMGPVFVGVLSDRLAPSHGSDALRIALAFAMFGHLWGAAHSLLSARTFRADRARASETID